MTYTIKLHHSEIALLVDALKKASARHTSYGKFYPGRQRARHFEVAAGMETLALKLLQLTE